jgi:hypothetical protein
MMKAGGAGAFLSVLSVPSLLNAKIFSASFSGWYFTPVTSRRRRLSHIRTTHTLVRFLPRQDQDKRKTRKGAADF